MAEWILKPRKYDDLIDQLLYNRGILAGESKKERDLFFDPNFDRDLFDPFLLKGMKTAAARIKEAKENGEKIGIYSDYDADGIPAAALFYKTLKAIGIVSEIYIPNRESGYGLSNDGIDYLVSRGCKLIVTADLGIRNIAEAKYCEERKIDLIITDHHIPGDKVPRALALINPKIKGNKYPFTELCGAGVVYKLAQALGKNYPKEINQEFLKSNLDLVAIATIADVVPLIGENRVLAHYGIIMLKITRNTGLRELLKVAGITKDKVNAYSVGFQIAPRINAPGRVDHATKSYDLLITDDKEKAAELAMWLNEKNEERQRAMAEVEKAAELKIEKEGLDKNNIIIVAGKWIKGVIGPSASHLVDKYCKPVILFSKDSEGKVYVGSARSVEGVDIVDLFEKSKKYIKKFGGHKGAAGLTVTNFKDFVKNIIALANKTIKPSVLIKKIKVDAVIQSVEMSLETCNVINSFEPFGMGNPKPVFLLRNVKVLSKRLIGATQKHLSAQVECEKKNFRLVGFNYLDSNALDDFNGNTIYDLVISLDINNWNGKSNVDLKMLDFKKAE